MAVEIYRNRAIFVTVNPVEGGGYVPHVQLGSVTQMEKGPPKTRPIITIPLIECDSYPDEKTALQFGIAVAKRAIDQGGYMR